MSSILYPSYRKVRRGQILIDTSGHMLGQVKLKDGTKRDRFNDTMNAVLAVEAGYTRAFRRIFAENPDVVSYRLQNGSCHGADGAALMAMYKLTQELQEKGIEVEIDIVWPYSDFLPGAGQTPEGSPTREYWLELWRKIGSSPKTTIHRPVMVGENHYYTNAEYAEAHPDQRWLCYVDLNRFLLESASQAFKYYMIGNFDGSGDENDPGGTNGMVHLVLGDPSGKGICLVFNDGLSNCVPKDEYPQKALFV